MQWPAESHPHRQLDVRAHLQQQRHAGQVALIRGHNQRSVALLKVQNTLLEQGTLIRNKCSTADWAHLFGEDLVRSPQVVGAGQVALGADHPVALVPAGCIAAAHIATSTGHDVCASLVRGPVAYVSVDCVRS